MRINENEKFDFKDERDVENFADILLKDYNFENEIQKENVRNLMLSIMYYVLAVTENEEKNLKKVKEIVSFNFNSLNSGCNECLFTNQINIIEEMVLNHPAVVYYKKLNEISLKELLNLFSILLNIIK